MINRNYIELNKIVLAGWGGKTLNQTFSRKNIISKFKNTRIWPLHLKAIDEVIRPTSLYIVLNQTKKE
jgi:hypothetical protein